MAGYARPRSHRITVVLAALVLLALAPPATAAPSQPQLVSEQPSAGPQILDGTVYAITQVGDVLVAGGSFSRVQAPGGAVARKGVVAWNTRTRALVSGFAPQLNGIVRTVLPGPVPDTVYVGGGFGTVNGAAARSLVLLRLSDGGRVPGFTAPNGMGPVASVQRVGSRLYVGGTFTTLAGQRHAGIATLDATTGAVDGKLQSDVEGHHSWTPDGDPRQVKGGVGVDRVAVSPDGTRLVAIGNFTTVDGQPRDQVAMWDISGPTAVLRSWHPPRYDLQCSLAYDSYVRDVDFSPDGSWFVIASTGGRRGGSLCDSAGRFETAGTGLDIAPTWVTTTGADSLLSVTITGAAVYLGGHQRWFNNARGGDVPGPGAVPRPGIAAVDPANGVPLAWNPGRHPRGAGAYALFASATALWVGSDTNYLGHDPRVLASKIGSFPLAGGRPGASKAAPGLPGTVLVGPVGAGSATARPFDGTNAGAPAAVALPLPVAALRGTTVVGNTLFYGKSDGLLYERHLSGSGAYGPEALVDPYNDPYWSSRANGSGPPIAPAGQTYRGVRPDFYSDPARTTGKTGELANVTALFYDGVGRLYYTVAGKAGLFYRPFSPDVTRSPAGGGVTTGGVVWPVEAQVKGVSLPPITGAFLTGGFLYYAKADGTLNRVSFSADGRPSGVPVVVGRGQVWSSRALFLRPSGG